MTLLTDYQSMYWAYFFIMSTGVIWLHMLLTIALCVTPDIIISVCEHIYNKRIMRNKEMEKRVRDLCNDQTYDDNQVAGDAGMNKTSPLNDYDIPPWTDKDDDGSEKSVQSKKGKGFGMFRRKKIRFELNEVKKSSDDIPDNDDRTTRV
jgi:hypothetical protein